MTRKKICIAAQQLGRMAAGKPKKYSIAELEKRTARVQAGHKRWLAAKNKTTEDE